MLRCCARSTQQPLAGICCTACLQEQLARLRGEADALAHEAGCQRAAAAARELLAAEELGRLRGRLQRAEAEQQALRKQLAAKQVC